MVTNFPSTLNELKDSIKELIDNYEKLSEMKKAKQTVYIDSVKKQGIDVGTYVTVNDYINLGEDFKGKNEVTKFYTSYVGLRNLISDKKIKIKGYKLTKVEGDG